MRTYRAKNKSNPLNLPVSLLKRLAILTILSKFLMKLACVAYINGWYFNSKMSFVCTIRVEKSSQTFFINHIDPIIFHHFQFNTHLTAPNSVCSEKNHFFDY